VSPDGGKVYATNTNSLSVIDNSLSVIDTATNTVSATIPVGSEPVAFGVFIRPPARAGQPPPPFAGVAGSRKKVGKKHPTRHGNVEQTFVQGGSARGR
jgi:YVTN family beta-propeller protein